MVELLAPLQKGMKDKNGNTALVYAHKSKHVDTVTVLRDHEAPSWTPLMCAPFTGDIEIAKKHLSAEDIAEFSDIFNNNLHLGGLGHTAYPWVREDSIFIHRQCTPSEEKACRVRLKQRSNRMS